MIVIVIVACPDSAERPDGATVGSYSFDSNSFSWRVSNPRAAAYARFEMPFDIM